MYLTALKICVLILLIFSAPGLAWQAVLKNTQVKLGLLTDTDMLLMIENGIRGIICHANRRYMKANTNT